MSDQHPCRPRLKSSPLPLENLIQHFLVHLIKCDARLPCRMVFVSVNVITIPTILAPGCMRTLEIERLASRIRSIA
jgi:hypothetical protein